MELGGLGKRDGGGIFRKDRDRRRIQKKGRVRRIPGKGWNSRRSWKRGRGGIFRKAKKRVE